MAVTDKPVSRRRANGHDNARGPEPDVGDILSKRFGGVSIYVVCMLLLATAIIWTGVKAAEQVQQYHQDYKILQDMRKQHRKLQVEHQRLLIEQQTFSATPQIASRAVAELGMYTPTSDDKLILQPSGSSNAISSATMNTATTAAPVDIATGSESMDAEVTP